MAGNDFWNGILRDYVDTHIIAERVTKTVAPTGEYRGWSISWDYGEYSATSPNYDASWEGPEDGWVDNGERVFAKTLPDLYAEVDAFLAERDPYLGIALGIALGMAVYGLGEVIHHGGWNPFMAMPDGPGLAVLRDPSPTSGLGAARAIPIAGEKQ